jgi:multiple sugar transport system permease protein
MIPSPARELAAGGVAYPRPAARPAAARQGLSLGRWVGRGVLYALVAFGAVLYAMPFVWMLSTAVKPGYQVYLVPPVWIPDHFEFENFVRPWRNLPFATFYKNTLVYTLTSVFGQLLSSSLVAFAFARMRFRGRGFLFVLILSTIMLPNQVTLVPVYILFTKLHWINTLLPLIVPNFFGGAFNIFLLRQYMMTIPLELDDAARIDGASWFQLYWRIILPLARPALGVVGVLSFTYHWNDYLYPLIYLNETKNFTVSLGLPLLNSRYVVDIQQTMAQSVLAVLPLLVLFFVAQRYYIQGIVVSGVKG